MHRDHFQCSRITELFWAEVMRADVDFYDTNGKLKGTAYSDSKSRWWYGVLVSGFCIGFIASQLLYMQSHRHHSPSELIHKRQLQHNAPASELEQILQQVAPQREVMIAISNYNLIAEGMLTTWLEVNTFAMLSRPGDSSFLLNAIVQTDTHIQGHLTG